MTEKYSTRGSEQALQEPTKKMVRDEHGNFVMQSIDLAETETVQQTISTEREMAPSTSRIDEPLTQEIFTPDESAIDSEMLSQDDEPALSSDSEKSAKATRRKKNTKEKAPLSVTDKLYRAVGLTTLAAVGWVGVAGGSNWVASKVRYGVDIGYRQQLDNATRIPDEIDRKIEQAKQAMDFINIFNMKEVTGGSND